MATLKRASFLRDMDLPDDVLTSAIYETYLQISRPMTHESILNEWGKSVYKRQQSLEEKTFTKEEIINIIEDIPSVNQDVYSWEDYTTHPVAFINKNDLMEKIENL